MNEVAGEIGEGRPEPPMRTLHVAFWNVRNLFEPGIVSRGPASDTELDAKLGVLADAIGRFFESEGAPDLLGLAEVGSESVLRRLIELLGRGSKSFLHLWEGPGSSDKTGLALVGRHPAVTDLRLLEVERRTPRDRPRAMVLEVGVHAFRDPLLVAVIHWKSGLEHPNDALTPLEDRTKSAEWLADALLLHERSHAIILGDFNAHPFEPPLVDSALPVHRFFGFDHSAKRLYSTAWRFLVEAERSEDRGDAYIESRPKTSYAAQSKDSSKPPGSDRCIWDQLMVSRSLLGRSRLELLERTVRLYCAEPVGVIVNGTRRPAGWRPDPATGAGVGASDHFPLCATFVLKGAEPMQTFKEWLEEKKERLPSLETASRSDELYEALEDVVKELDSELSASGVRADLRMGWLVDLGQQYNIELSFPRKDREAFRVVLFRAYVPMDDESPVILDFYDERFTRCPDRGSIFSAVLDFRKRPETRRTLRRLVDQALREKNR